jgi:phosphoglycerol transferase MdoB-like AlkP superfamily enzyme
MKKFILSLLTIMLFWLVFFTLGRSMFIAYHYHFFIIEGVPLRELFQMFYYAFRLDVSTLCYISVLPFIILLLQTRYNKKWLDLILRIYTVLLIVVFSFIIVGEIGVYPEWKSKLDYKSLHYLNHPEEMAQSTSAWNFIVMLLLTSLLVAISIYLFNKVLYKQAQHQRTFWWKTLLAFILVPAFLFLGIRGGVQEIPINQAQSYFSKHNIVNLVSVNPVYNLWYSVLQSTYFQKDNPFLYYPIEDARRTVKQIHALEKDTTISVLNTNRPNIVLLIMESWSADLIESLGGEPGITPEFRKLEQEGILFTQLYSSGNRSQQGMASIFGGFPSLPITAISNHFNKFVKLPSLVKDLKKEGYSTSYYFGGQLIYGGLRAYIIFNDFDRILEDKDFDAYLPRGRLGIHDQYTLEKQLNDLDKERQPFFSTLFTVSTHSPYDQPMEKVLQWGGNENQYINSGYYTDRCLGEYIAKARQRPWFNNTLFIVVADHSHNTYRNYWLNTPAYRKIPMLFFGNAIKKEWRGRQFNRVSSQTDIAGTLLPQLGLKATEFHWSKNLFNPYTGEFAYFEVQIGCGWIRPDGFLAWDHTAGRFEQNTFPDNVKEQRIREGKSYLEVLFQQFMDY